MVFEDLTDPVNELVAEVLGIPATWTPRATGSPVSLQAVFRREHRMFDADTGALIASTSSSAWVKASDLPREPLEDDRFEIAGLSFVVASIEPDGQGGILLVLQRAPEP